MTLPILVYSHSSYHDVLDLSLQAASETNFFTDFNCVVNTSAPYKSKFSIKSLVYKEEDKYSKRMLGACKFLKTMYGKYFILMHEDFFVYKDLDTTALDKLARVLDSNNDLDFIRLIRSNDPNLNKYDTNLYISQNNLCIQATLFRTESLISYLESVDCSMYDIEARQDSNMEGLFYFEGTERKVGIVHYESKIFPYMATAISTGKWNSEYRRELEVLHNKYNIDSSKRGWT